MYSTGAATLPARMLAHHVFYSGGNLRGACENDQSCSLMWSLVSPLEERCRATRQLFIERNNFGPCRVQLDPGNQLWTHIRHAERRWPLEDVCSSWCACARACLSAPSVFSRGYIELCLCQVPKPPIFPPLCSTSIFSIKFSSCWHFVHPPGPQIFIPAYHSRACGQCWIHASIRFLRLLPQEKKGGKKHADICMDLEHTINQRI